MQKFRKCICLLGACTILQVTLPVSAIMYQEVEGDYQLYKASIDDPDTKEWELVWSDEFDGEALNENNWSGYVMPSGKMGNSEQYYTGMKNISVHDGVLEIEARYEKYEDADYTSGMLYSFNKVHFNQGRIDARIKMPSGNGMWSAFWLLGYDTSWPKCGEIDIVEEINTCDKAYGTVHWGIPGEEPDTFRNKEKQGSTVIETPRDWHTYSLVWTESKMRWMLDEKVYHEVEYDINSVGQSAFTNEFFMILNLTIGGDWPKSVDPGAFPQCMYVDYIRLYQ